MAGSSIAKISEISQAFAAMSIKLAKDTERSYRNRLRLLKSKPAGYELALECAAKDDNRQFRKIKGAVVWHLNLTLKDVSEKWLHRGQCANGQDRRSLGDQILALSSLLERIKVIQKGPQERKARPSGSKRSSIAKLPSDFIEQAAARLKPGAVPSGLVLMLTGCRPAELEKGVELFVQRGRLIVQIAGAKVTKSTGHEWRLLLLSTEKSPMVKELFQIV